MAIVPGSLSSVTIALMLLIASPSTYAFSGALPSQNAIVGNMPTSNLAFLHASRFQKSSSIIMSMSEEPSAEAEEASASEEEGAVEEEEEAPQEDPEITALKEEIANLESDLKAKRTELNRNVDLAEEYSERGYQRKCAEMDNMRRMRAAASDSNLEAAKANVIQAFLPNLSQLQYITDTYGENFYTALKNEFDSIFISMNLASFTVDVGSKMDPRRCTVVAEEDVEDVDEAGIVLRVERDGFEVSGNVISFAEVVVSKGKEPESSEEESTAGDEEIAPEE